MAVLLTLALGLALVGDMPMGSVPKAYAAPAAQLAGTLVSGVTVQNLNKTTPANIVIKFYDQSGTQVPPLSGVSAVLPAGGQRTWYLPTHVPELPSPFLGSAIVESDRLVMASVNTQLPSGTNPMRLGTALGVSSPSTRAYLPQILKDYYGWNSHFAVQNAGASAASVRVKYIDLGGSEVVAARQTRTIQPNASFLYKPSDNGSLPSGFGGSVVVESDQPIATQADFFNAGTDVSTMQFHSYNGFSSGGTKVYLPRLVRGYYDYNSGLRVQNVSDRVADVTITYYFGSTVVSKNLTLNPGQAGGPYLGSNNSDTSGLPAGVSGSAVITSNVPVVATINEDNRVLGRGVTFNGVPDGQQTANLFFPQVTARYYGYSSGIQVQNVGSSVAQCTATFTMAGRDPITVNFSIQPNKAWSKFIPDVDGIGWDFNGAVTVTSNRSIVGIANMSFRSDRDSRYSPIEGDTFATYNGTNIE